MSRVVRASVDLGTNTCLLLIAEYNSAEERVTKVIEDQIRYVRLGEGVDQKRELVPAAMERTLECLKEYRSILDSKGVAPAEVACVATSQARDAKNGDEFFSRVFSETQFQFQVLSGADEARFSFSGALLPDSKVENTAVIDIGGGSTEYMSRMGGQSLDLGAVRFTERFLKSDPVTDKEFWECQEAIDEELKYLQPWRKTLPEGVELLGVAGTVTTLAAWHRGIEEFDSRALDGVTLSCGDIHRLVEELKWRTVEERKKLTGVEEKRADVLLAGAMILWRSCEVLSFPEVHVSSRGLRYGVLARTS